MLIWVSKEPYRSDKFIYGVCSEPLESKRMKQKMQKTETLIFHFIVLPRIYEIRLGKGLFTNVDTHIVVLLEG